MAKNIYPHKIDLKALSIRNTNRQDFAAQLIGIEYRGYEVEQCDDGRKIVITKPGGKRVFGQPQKEDILVFIFNPTDETLWQITHKQIFEDVEAKCQENKEEGKKFISLLERTLNGEEPMDFIEDIRSLSFQTGEKPEVLIKAYKWIWGQEDVNYPNGEGRFKSWSGYVELLKSL